jgi:hypothetical protein
MDKPQNKNPRKPHTTSLLIPLVKDSPAPPHSQICHTTVGTVRDCCCHTTLGSCGSLLRLDLPAAAAAGCRVCRAVWCICCCCCVASCYWLHVMGEAFPCQCEGVLPAVEWTDAGRLGYGSGHAGLHKGAAEGQSSGAHVLGWAARSTARRSGSYIFGEPK